MQATLNAPDGNALDVITPKIKPLWAVVGILSVCLLALGASFVHIKQRTAEPVARRFTAVPFALWDRLSDVKRAEARTGQSVEDGSTRSLELANAPALGGKALGDGKVLFQRSHTAPEK